MPRVWAAAKVSLSTGQHGASSSVHLHIRSLTLRSHKNRVNTNRVLFEIGGIPIREELAREALRQASAKLPCVMEFITRATPPRVGNLDIVPEGFTVRSGKMVPLAMTVPKVDVSSLVAHAHVA